MDSFPEYTGTPGPPPTGQTTNGLVMGYYDGNTVTALWNYAQHFAMNDNSYGTNFGPSTPGAINLISGQTNGVDRPVECRRRRGGRRRRRLHADQRRRSDWRYVLDDHRRAGSVDRPEHRRSAERGGHHLGLVRGRLRSRARRIRTAPTGCARVARPRRSPASPRRRTTFRITSPSSTTLNREPEASVGPRVGVDDRTDGDQAITNTTSTTSTPR